MKHLSVNAVEKALREIGYKTFAVEFTTKEGEYRKYTGRINVTKGVKGNEAGKRVAESFKATGTVPMKTHEGKYKSFKLHQVISLKCGNTQVKA